MNTIVRKTMEEKIVIRTSRGEQRVMRIEALFLKTVESSFAGNQRASLAVMQAYAKAVPERAEPDQATEVASADRDLEIIEAFKAVMRIGETADEDTDEERGSDDE